MIKRKSQSVSGRIEHKTIAEKKEIVDRIHRVVGQIQGVERMVKKNKGCLAIVQQIVAARNALARVATKILAQESCQRTEKDKKEFEKLIDNLIDLN